MNDVLKQEPPDPCSKHESQQQEPQQEEPQQEEPQQEEPQHQVPERVWQQPVAVWLLVFTLGIFADAYLRLPVSVWFWPAIAQVVASVFAWRDPSSLLLLAVGFSATGGLSHAAFQRLVARDNIATISAEMGIPVVLDGVVDGRVRRWDGQRGPRWSVPVRVTRLRNGTSWRKASGRMMVVGHGEWSPRTTSPFRWHGILLRPSCAKNPGEIDSRKQLALQRIHVELRMPQGALPRPLDEPLKLSIAQRVRRRACETTKSQLPPKQAALIQAMTWGERSALESREKRRFMLTGTAHYLAISGLHLGMLCGLFLALRRFDILPRRVLWIGVILFSCSYALICGARTPILRATWLVLVSISGRWQGRRTLQWSRLAAAGWAVLLLRPADLWDPGAQLSFLAVAILLLPRNSTRDSTRDSTRAAVDEEPIESLLRQTRPRWQQRIRNGVAQLGGLYRVNFRICFQMAPLVALHFEFLAIGALVFSPLMGPPVAFALITSFLLAIFAGLPLVDFALRLGCVAALVAIDAILALAGPNPPIWPLQPTRSLVQLFYIAWLVRHGLGGWPLRGVWRWRILLTVLWFVALLIRPAEFRVWRPEPSQHKLCLTFVSVGHGLAVVVQTPDGQTWLYDAGSTGDGRYAARRIDGVLQHLGVRRLDGIVVSHFDADHYNALPMLVGKYSARCLVSNDERVHKWLQQAEVSRATLASKSSRTSSPKSEIALVVPPSRHWSFAKWGQLVAGADRGGDNGRSLALFGAFGTNDFCLTGDLEGAGLAQLLKSPTEPLDVVLVPHHGSRHSQPEQVAQWARPTWAVISGGWRDCQPEVEQAYRHVGATVLHTDDGAVRVVMDEQGPPKVFQWRHGRWRSPNSPKGDRP